MSKVTITVNLYFKQHVYRVEKSMISNDYIGISGEPGSGKSFLSTILTREFLKKDILCLTISLQSVPSVQSSKWSKGSEKLSLVDFLVQYSTIDFYPTKSDLDHITHFFQQNQTQLVLLLEGLDQFQDDLEPINESARFNSKKSPKIWLSHLIGRNILTGSKLFVTSRPLTFTKLPGDLQPSISYSLYDIRENKMFNFIKFHFPDKSKDIIKEIEANDVLNIAKHPMSMFLIGRSYIDGDLDFTDITMYQLFLKLFEKFLCNTNVAGTKKPNLQSIMRKVEEICFRMIETNQYVVTTDLLKDYVPITLNDFEDVLRIDAGSKSGISYQVDESQKILTFNHQLEVVSYFTKSWV